MKEFHTGATEVLTEIAEWSPSSQAYCSNDRRGAAYRLVREGDAWQVLAAPDSAGFTAQVPWTGPVPKTAAAIDEDGTELRQTPIRIEVRNLILTYDPKTFAYVLR